MKKLLPILLALIGLGAGIGGGLALRPPPPDPELADACGDIEAILAAHALKSEGDSEGEDEEAVPTIDYVKMNNQFIIPDVDDGEVVALVVLSISLEVKAGGNEVIFQYEPKLRDVFLQVLFDHANSGGFKGTFTDSTNMTVLRNALRESAIKTIGDTVTDVLITDIVRQDTT